MKETYIEICFHVKADYQELLIAELSLLEFDSFWQEEDHFKAYIQNDLFQATEIVMLKLKHAPVFTFDFDISHLEQKNWNEEWEKNYPPIYIQEKLHIRAPFHEHRNDVALEITIMPKMAFGTGHHDTTLLMALELTETEIKNKRVLDAGCGSGILAIIAAKKEASFVLAYDIDSWSTENTEENKGLNSTDKIVVQQGTIHEIEASEFDIIIANINRNILLEEIPFYAKKLNKHGKILLSGFYKEDIKLLEEKLQAYHLRVVKQKSSDLSWSLIVAKFDKYFKV